ncbi:Hypp831 [Branchiostoma lanceolatum]|uniref:Hypp831 protein n=1 Tax=Branchiostoma lanceolatum TaxID=7740 RepID=A0A8J9VNZ3_BRALA|nr:Hypp831 [Branchiostoma lanceolatum]
MKRLLVLLFIILKETGPTAAHTCTCSSWVCNCAYRGLTSVPQDLPTTITQLNLGRNPITTLSQDHNSPLHPNDLHSAGSSIYPQTCGNL